MDPQEDASDPYNLIKAEIDAELQAMTSLQAKLFAGHGEVAAVLATRLKAAAEQLAALESAVQSMVADPTKYGLTAAAAFGRQVSDIGAREGLPSAAKSKASAAAGCSCPCTPAAQTGSMGAA